jgi:hypothetical protein
VTAAWIAVILGLAAIAFGYWGTFTDAGRRSFDEMAGMIPFFSMIVGIAIAVIGILVLVYLRWKRA